MIRTILTALVAILTLSCAREPGYITVEGGVWATTYHVTYQGDKALADSILPTLNRMAASVSVFEPTSLVSKVNAGCECRVDSTFIKVYNASLLVNSQTAGAFDPTVGPLIELWGFGKNRVPKASVDSLEQTLEYVGLSKTHLRGDTLCKDDPRIAFNFSAIAKGYGCDMVADMFRRNGVENFLIEIGGEIAASGVSPRGDKWNVSIDTPTPGSAPGSESVTVISVSDCGVATSGNYRNSHTDSEGNTFGHTMDPVTGRPAKTDVLSATVIAPTTMMADAYATSAMVLGSKKALELAERLKLPMLLVLPGDKILTSSQMNQYLSQ